MDQAKKGDTVKVHYTGKLENGEVFDSSAGQEPIEFTIGEGNILRGVELAVVGMTPGDTKTATIEPDDAYGEYQPSLVQDIEKARFPDDIKVDLGQQLQISRPSGPPLIVTVVGVTDTHVTLDANHPLAGKNLTFDIELVEIAE